MGRYWRRRNALAGARYQDNAGPPILTSLATTWGLQAHDTYNLWRGLCRACWSESVAWREALIAFHPDTQEPTAFLVTMCHPKKTMRVVECLVAEGWLTRPTASRIEHAMLDTPGWVGDWRQWAPPEGREALAGLDLADYVEQYWS
jgi:hypothetical protein